MLLADSDSIWEAQWPLPRGEQAWDISPASVSLPVTQPHSLLLFSTCLGLATFGPSEISGSTPRRNLRWTGKAEAHGMALLGGGK